MFQDELGTCLEFPLLQAAGTPRYRDRCAVGQSVIPL